VLTLTAMDIQTHALGLHAVHIVLLLLAALHLLALFLAHILGGLKHCCVSQQHSSRQRPGHVPGSSQCAL